MTMRVIWPVIGNVRVSKFENFDNSFEITEHNFLIESAYAARNAANTARTVSPLNYVKRKPSQKAPSRAVLKKREEKKRSTASTSNTVNNDTDGVLVQTNTRTNRDTHTFDNHLADFSYSSEQSSLERNTSFDSANDEVLTTYEEPSDFTSDNEYFDVSDSHSVTETPEVGIRSEDSNGSLSPSVLNQNDCRALQQGIESHQESGNKSNQEDDSTLSALNPSNPPDTGVSNDELERIQNVLVADIEFEFADCERFPTPFIDTHSIVKNEPANDGDPVAHNNINKHALFGNHVFELQVRT